MPMENLWYSDAMTNLYSLTCLQEELLLHHPVCLCSSLAVQSIQSALCTKFIM